MKTKHIVLLAVGGLAIGGAIYVNNAYRIVKNAKFVPNIRVHDFTSQGLRLVGEVIILNPTNASMEIEHPALNLYIEDSKNLLAYSPPLANKWYRIVPNGQTVMDGFEFTIPYLKMLRLARELSDGKFKLRVEVNTSISKNLISIPVKEVKEIEILLPANIIDLISNL